MMFHIGVFFLAFDPSDGVFRRMLGMARSWIKVNVQVVRGQAEHSLIPNYKNMIATVIIKI
jgi:hypothetical protein